MRKRGLTYVLAAMMLIGSTGISGGYVRADEPAITEEGENETEETEEPTEKTTEETEFDLEDVESEADEVKLEVGDVSLEAEDVEKTEDSDGIVDITDDQFVESDDLPGAKYDFDEYFKDYDYFIDSESNTVFLKEYKGDDTDVFIPYITENRNGLLWTAFGQHWTENRLQVSIWSDVNILDNGGWEFVSNVKSITFDEGFKFPAHPDALFSECVSLENIDFSGVDTSEVCDMNYMFEGCESLKSLNLSSFDMSKVTDAYGMFARCYSLKIINTPLNVKCDIELPRKMYDVDGNVYTTLPKNMSKSIKLAQSTRLFKNGWYKNSKGIYRFYDHDKVYSGPRIIAKMPTKNTWWVAGSDGKHDTSFTGIAPKNTNGHLRFARNGVMDLTFTGLALDPDNHWRFVRNGAIDSSFTGIAQNTNGKWYYCTKGRVDTSFTNMIAKNTNGKYYYVLNGRPTSKFNGIAYCPEVKNWYYCTNGKVDFKFSGKVAPCTNGNWYYVTKSRIDYTFTGVAEGTDGKKYYVIKGLVDRTFSGTVTYNKITYNVVNGVVKN